MTMNGSNTNLAQLRISMMLLCWYCLLSITNASIYEECTIVTEIDNNTPWTEYTIAATGNYSIDPICRCSVGKPKWEYYSKDENTFKELQTYSLCKNDGQSCNLQVIQTPSPSKYIYATLNNYVATETTTLYCKNTENNYAPAISIVITQDCPEAIIDDSLTSSTVQVISPSQTHISSPSPSPFSMSSSIPSISNSQSTQVTITTSTTSSTSSISSMDSSIAATIEPSPHVIITSTIYITTSIRDMCTTTTTTTTTTTQATTATNRITQNNVDGIEDLNDYKMVSYILVAVVCVSMILVIILSILLLIATMKKKNSEHRVTCIDTLTNNHKEDHSMAYDESIKKHNEYVINT